MIRTCLFCEVELTNSNKSNEHIIPQWLLDHLSIREFEIDPTHMTPKGSVVSKRSHTLNNFLCGNVCQKCNGGWMSKLEVKAKPILIDLIEGNKTVIEYEQIDRFTIAQWALKTSLTLNSGSNFLKNIPRHHFHELYSNKEKLPDNVTVLAQQHHNTEPFYWQQGAVWMINGTEITKVEEERFLNETYKVSLQLGKLLLNVNYLPFNDFLPVLWKGIHVPYFPKTRPCGWYERKEFPWNDSIDAIVSFHMGVEAIKKE